ncbi:hypothetical protein D3C80_2153710 [compost metagenome]
MGDQVEEEGLFAGRRVLQQLDQACGLLGSQGKGREVLLGTLRYVFKIGFKHDLVLWLDPAKRDLGIRMDSRTGS